MKSGGIASRIWGWLCALLALAVVAIAMRPHGFGIDQQLRLAGATLVQIMLPGLGLTAWLRRPTLVGWAAAAFLVGLPVQLLGWGIGVSTGIVALMWIIPVVVALLGLWLTRRRIAANWRHRVHLSFWEPVVLLAVWAAMVVRVAAHWAEHPGGDRATAWYQDLYWHLGINASATQRIPIQDPQAVGENLTYHWLTNGHIAGLVRSAGLDLLTTSVHAWVLPVIAVTIGAVFGLAHHISRSTAAGALAAALWLVVPSFAINRAVRDGGFGNFQLNSPSHMLAMPVTVMVIWLFVVALKSGAARRRAVWLPLVLTLLLVSGVKVSALPALACGAIAALFSTLILRRRRLTALGLVGLVGVILAGTFPLFGGGGGGSVMLLFQRQRELSKWETSLEQLPELASEPWFGIYIGLLIANALWMLPGVFAMRWRDPVGWLLAGAISSAIGVIYVLRHPGGSEAYFPMGFQPVMAVAAAVGIAYLCARVGRPWKWGGALVAIVALLGGIHLSEQPLWDVLTTDRLTSAATAGGVSLLVALVLVVVLGWRRGAALVGAAFLAFSAGNGSNVVQSVFDDIQFLGPEANRELRASIETRPSHVTPDEMAALKHVATLPKDAIVATNVHCRYVKSTDFCNARAFWVAALGQRRVLLGGWGYTNLGRSTEGQNGLSHNNNPYPDEELYALNERAFQAPDAATFEELKQRGATHLFADRRASEVADLDAWCEPTFENATVSVCEIR